MNKDIDVLIVDDEVDICYLLTSILNKKNLKTAFVNTLKQASDILAVAQPSIIFLDNNLPDGFGVNFIKQIKMRQSIIKVIMITADDAAVYKNIALNAGADYFIDKPFNLDKINKAVDEMLMVERIDL